MTSSENEPQPAPDAAPDAAPAAARAPEPPPDAAPAPEAPKPRASQAVGAMWVTLGILLSRVFGLVRQRVMAHYFGTSELADVIAAAFRVGNITQNLLGEGTLSASFIPVYAKLRAEGKQAEAKAFALSALGLLLGVVVLASAIGAAFAKPLTLIIAAGFEGDRFAATVRLVRVVFPMTGVLVVAAWALGVLNAHRRFFLPYAAPVLWNVVQIAALVAFGTFLHWGGESLAMVVGWSAGAGAVLQLLVLLPSARKLVGGLRPRFDTKNPDVREAARRLPGAIAGRGIIQISGLVDTLLVSFLGPGENAVFSYAQTVYLLPVSLLGTGEAAAALPELASDTAEEDREKRREILRQRVGASLGRVAVLAIPAGVALIALGRELVVLLLQTGKFDREASARVGVVLAAYGVSLLGNAAGRMLGTTLFALGDTKTPARYALVRVAVSTALSLVFMRFWGVFGVVLGAVIAGWVEAILLGARVRKEIGGLGLSKVRFVAIGLLGAGAGLVGLGARWLLPEDVVRRPLGAAAVLGAFGVAFLVLGRALGLVSPRALLRRR